MKISLLIPTNNFLEALVPELEKLEHKVLVNNCDKDCDVIIGMSDSQLANIIRFHSVYLDIPLITYNWDWYDHKTYSPVWIQMMKESKDVWSASKITSEKCEKDTGIKSEVWMYAYILPDEWKGKKKDDNYIIQASRNDDYKRFDWFERATRELGLPYKSYHPGVNPRPDYIQAIKNCSILCVCSREESLGTLSAMEASYCGKPVLISDFEGAKEVWQDDVTYFEKDSFEDFKKKLKELWQTRNGEDIKKKVERAYRKVKTKFLPKNMAQAINKRLEEIL